MWPSWGVSVAGEEVEGGGEKKEALYKTEIRRDDPALHWNACDVVGTLQHVTFASPRWNKVNWRTSLASQLEKKEYWGKREPIFFSLHVNDSCVVEQMYWNQERGRWSFGTTLAIFFFCRHWSQTLVSRPSEEPCWSLSLSLSLSCSVTVLSPVGFIASLRQRILIKYKFSTLLGVQLHFPYWPKTMCVFSSFFFRLPVIFFLFILVVWFRTFLHDLIRGT